MYPTTTSRGCNAASIPRNSAATSSNNPNMEPLVSTQISSVPMAGSLIEPGRYIPRGRWLRFGRLQVCSLLAQLENSSHSLARQSTLGLMICPNCSSIQPGTFPLPKRLASMSTAPAIAADQSCSWRFAPASLTGCPFSSVAPVFVGSSTPPIAQPWLPPCPPPLPSPLPPYFCISCLSWLSRI